MGAGAAAAVAAMMQAIKASGAIVQVPPDDFLGLLGRAESPLVVTSTTEFFSTRYHYLAPYKGLIFYAKSTSRLSLPAGAEVVQAKKIWVPG